MLAIYYSLLIKSNFLDIIKYIIKTAKSKSMYKAISFGDFFHSFNDKGVLS
jgi:hypothetical protein